MSLEKCTQPLTVAILFDTTGSMAGYLGKVKRHVHQMGKRLAKHFPQLRLGIVAYGDHCDEPLMLQECAPTTDLKAFSSFVKKVKSTCGGDIPEALECALESILHWHWGGKEELKIAVLLTDAPAHTVDECPQGNNYQKIASELAAQGVSFYTCLCGKDRKARKQLKELAKMSLGKFLKLEETKEVVPLIVAAAAHKGGILDAYVKELKREGRLDNSAKAVLVKLGSSACHL